MNESVLLGFSGGIDSRTAAAKLCSEGYRVVALTIDTLGDKDMMVRAEALAKELNIDWVGYDKRDCFRRDIIDYFKQEYILGHTPAPCTRCNSLIKWRTLCDVADAMNIEHIATGHYFNIENHCGLYYVTKGADSNKDQSYYLWGLDQSTLSRALTPMGNEIKSVVKQSFSDKRESMGVCFLDGLPYAEYLRRSGVKMIAGDVVDYQGNIIGQHDGIAHYTIGQRRGSGIPAGLRVVDIDAEQNRIVVGTNEMLFKHRLDINQCNVVNIDELLSADDVTIKIRGIGRNPELPVKIEPTQSGYRITTNDPAWAPAIGQPLVFYRKNLVIGGGIVAHFE